MTKIFIVEDEETLLEIYSERFKRKGYLVSAFKNGLEMIEALSDTTPDVVLLDVNMPEMNGYEVLETLHKNFSDKKKQNVPIIIWSNISNESEISQLKKLGADEILKKVEYTGDDLVARVQEVVDNLK